MKCSFVMLALGVVVMKTVLGHVIPEKDNDVIDKVTGHLHLITDNDGGHRRLKKRDVSDMDGSQRVKLDLGSTYGSIEMSLNKHSVWAADSKLVRRVKEGEEAVEADVDLKTDCFLSGLLPSQGGVASFAHCNGLRGFVRTPDIEYMVEQIDPTAHQSHADMEIPELAVTLIKPSPKFMEGVDIPDTIKPEETAGSDDIQNEKTILKDEEDDDMIKVREFSNDTLEYTQDIRRMKRGTPDPIAADIAVYVSQHFAEDLEKRGFNTILKIWEFMMTKWNAIDTVLGDVEKVGVPFDVYLKKVEVWWTNPNWYKAVENESDLDKHLKVFKPNTYTEEYNHRMLYITGNRNAVGRAYVGTMCSPRWAASIVVSPTSAVDTDLHELGHGLYFNHDHDMGCSGPKGFMSAATSELFLPCYRKRLLQKISNGQLDCLRERYQQKLEGKDLFMILKLIKALFHWDLNNEYEDF